MTQIARSRQAARTRAARPQANAPEPQASPLFIQATDTLKAAQRVVHLRGLKRGPVAFASEAGIDAVEALYAALGGIAAGQLPAVRGTLQALFALQRADGRLPSRLTPLAGWRAKLLGLLGRHDDTLVNARYTEGLVPTALALWVGAAYVEATGDRQFMQDHQQAFARASAWLETQQQDGLPACLGETPTLLAGVLAYRARLALGEMAVPRGEAVEAARHWASAAALREKLNATFWDAGLGRYQEEGPSAGRANLLAATCGLAARGQALAVLARVDDGFGLTAGWGFHALAASEQADGERLQRASERAMDEAAHLGGFTPGEAGRLLYALAPGAELPTLKRA